MKLVRRNSHIGRPQSGHFQPLVCSSLMSAVGASRHMQAEEKISALGRSATEAVDSLMGSLKVVADMMPALSCNAEPMCVAIAAARKGL